MRKLFLLLFVIVAIMAIGILIFLSQSTSPEIPLNDETFIVDSTGGTYNINNKRVTLTFPSGAVNENTEVTVKAKTSSSEEGIIPGTIYEFEPNMQFAKPVSLTIKYDPTKLPESAIGSLMCIVKFNGTSWNPIYNSTIDETQNSITTEITSFSEYGAYSFFARLTPNSEECGPGGVFSFFIETNLPGDSYDFTIARNQSGQVGSIVESIPQWEWAAPRHWQITFRVFEDAKEGEEEELLFFLEARKHFIVGGAFGSSGGNLKSKVWTEFRVGDDITTLKFRVKVSGFAVLLEPFGSETFWVSPGSYRTIQCIINGLPSETKSQLIYQWNCTCKYGYLDVNGFTNYSGSGEQSLETDSNKVSYNAYSNGTDYDTDQIWVTLYKVEGDKKTSLDNQSYYTGIEIYNPQTRYYFCSDSLGTKGPDPGSGSDWSAFIVDHGRFTSGMTARPLDFIRITCKHGGVEPSDLYLRIGEPGAMTIKTKLLVSKEEFVTGLDKTILIEILDESLLP